jgi:hypothetical protein
VLMNVVATTRLEMVSSLTPPNNDLTVADFSAGFKSIGTVQLTAKSNAAASISISSSTNPSGYSGVSWSTDGSHFTDPSTLFTTSGATAGLAKSITFRTKLAWAADAPGSYTQTINFTISAP